MKPQSYYDNLTRKELPTHTDKLVMSTIVVIGFISICAYMGALV